MAEQLSEELEINLTAAIISIDEAQPQSLVITDRLDREGPYHLPSGAFSPTHHRTMEKALRHFVLEQTGLNLGYVEQLYTFADRGRALDFSTEGKHIVSTGYLALSTPQKLARPDSLFIDLYQLFPWEDWRKGAPVMIDKTIIPYLEKWQATVEKKSKKPMGPLSIKDRLHLCFGLYGGVWDEEKALDRYELLYQAGFISEARRDRTSPHWPSPIKDQAITGAEMLHDHRRILATALSRLRGKIKYRPIIFELLDDAFTLLQLQRCVETIGGLKIHKQNFRRLVETSGLVEEAGAMSRASGGRPAKLYRFRKDVLLERPSAGVKLTSVQK